MVNIDSKTRQTHPVFTRDLPRIFLVPLLKKVANQAKNTRAEPSLLRDPKLNLLEVGRQDVGCKVLDKTVRKLLELGIRGQGRRVTIAGIKSVQTLVGPTFGLPPGVLLQLLRIRRQTLERQGLFDHLNEKGTPGDQ